MKSKVKLIKFDGVKQYCFNNAFVSKNSTASISQSYADFKTAGSGYFISSSISEVTLVGKWFNKWTIVLEFCLETWSKKQPSD